MSSIRTIKPWAAIRIVRRLDCANCSGKPFTSSASTRQDSPTKPLTKIDVEELLSKPTWSVSSLLPTGSSSDDSPAITPKQLHHLLRLSALPPPKDDAEEKQMLSTLSSQLHFVREIQKIDTSNVEPLRSLRDETSKGVKEAELGPDALRDALSQEESVGKFHRRIRRKREGIATTERDANWNVLGAAGKRVGRFFVVEGGKT